MSESRSIPDWLRWAPHVWSDDRSGNKRASAAAALSLVLERLAATDS